jgi:hypothetical protein
MFTTLKTMCLLFFHLHHHLSPGNGMGNHIRSQITSSQESTEYLHPYIYHDESRPAARQSGKSLHRRITHAEYPSVTARQYAPMLSFDFKLSASTVSSS